MMCDLTMFPCRLILQPIIPPIMSPSHSVISQKRENHNSFQNLLFCLMPFLLLFFFKLFNSPFLKWVLIHQEYLLVTCAGHQPSPAAALDWARWCTGLSVPLHHRKWLLFKGPSITGCSALQCALYSLGALKYSYYTHHNHKASHK